MPLLIDNEPIDWTRFGKNAKRKFSAPHTWVVARRAIKRNPATGQLEHPIMKIATRYHSIFRYGAGEIKAEHLVEYYTGIKQKKGEEEKHPLIIEIPRKGYLHNMTNAEINFFFTYAPFREDGIAYDKDQIKRVILFDQQKIADMKEEEVDMTMRVLERIRNLRTEAEIMAVARTVTSIKGIAIGFTINEQLMMQPTNADNQMEKQNHIAQIKTGLFKFAQRDPRYLKNMLGKKDAQIYAAIERARALDILKFRQDNSTAKLQGRWVLENEENGKTTELCLVYVNQLRSERLVQFLSNPDDSEKKASEDAFAELLRESEDLVA